MQPNADVTEPILSVNNIDALLGYALALRQRDEIQQTERDQPPQLEFVARDDALEVEQRIRDAARLGRQG